jgi:hypothetical protein
LDVDSFGVYGLFDVYLSNRFSHFTFKLE